MAATGLEGFTDPLVRAVRRRSYLIAATSLVVLNVADIAVTRAALQGGASELNPIARLFVDYGWVAFPVKFGVPFAVLVLAMTRQVRLREWHVAAIWFVVGVYTLAVVLNVVTWVKLG